jgi:hypothetical protein
MSVNGRKPLPVERRDHQQHDGEALTPVRSRAIARPEPFWLIHCRW